VGGESAAPLTLGTAGHIDHGKTALVRALTGVDTDRLEEEKRRGISIALGYAALELPSGRRLSVIDVPGHERFVRTMVAGATGIDLFLMVIAADDGVMPQTREHFAVLRALGVEHGVVAVTKCDVAEPPEVDVGWEVVPVSAKSGDGLAELLAALDRAADRVGGREAAGGAVLHVDRVFSVRGAGTVVTGTLWSGSLSSGDVVSVLPSGREARVRSVEVHDERVESAAAGQRVAVNLVGLDRDEAERGDVIVRDVDLAPAYVLDVELDFELAERRVMVHHGTRETAARVVARDSHCSLRCERPLMARAGDRVVIRSIAPPDTLGGGVVLERPAASTGLSNEPQRSLRSPKGLDEAALALEERLRDEPAAYKDVAGAAFEALREHGRAVRVGPLAYATETLAAAERTVREVIERDGSITLASLRDELQTSRKYAQALLEHFDHAHVTRRLADDARVLRSR
jgi:selenocysteine-specific elongation factor